MSDCDRDLDVMSVLTHIMSIFSSDFLTVFVLRDCLAALDHSIELVDVYRYLHLLAAAGVVRFMPPVAVDGHARCVAILPLTYPSFSSARRLAYLKAIASSRLYHDVRRDKGF